jgi:hypothetical protein
MAKVYVSAGHSANDPGAVKYVVERDEVWTISNMVAEELEALGITAYRDKWDYGWRDTVNDANAKGVDLFVEYHENAGGGEGAECIIHNSGNQRLADCIQEAFKEVGQKWRRTIVDPSFWVLKYTDAPAVIVEVAFVDNKTDIAKFDTDSEKRTLAKAQAKAIAKYLGVKTTKTGWIKDKVGWWYKRADGSYPKNEWEKIDGKWYHFDLNGYMETGWRQINNPWFYLTDSGAMKTGWLKYNNHWFYFDENGYMITGWVKYNGYWFYFQDSGIMKTGWVAYKDKWYYCSEQDGKMISDEFRKVKGDWYRFAPDGTMLEKTTLEVGKDGKITV